MQTEQNRFHVLDSLRGVCAILVALSHFKGNSVFQDVPVFENGSIYVDFFFVLSGFVIFANYEQKIRNGFGIGKFMFLRLGRLYPLHFFVFMAFILVDLAQLVLPVSGALIPPFSAPGETPKDIVANLLLIHSLNVSEVLAFNGPSWSISVEFYTYLIFACLIALTGRFTVPAIALLTACSAVFIYYLFGELYAKLDYGIFRCIYGFGCGALVWKLYHSKKDIMQKILADKKHALAIEVCLFLMAVFYIWFFGENGASMFAPLVFSALIFVIAFESSVISGFLKKRIFIFLGTISYSIYMIHLFVAGKFFELPFRILESRGMATISKTVDGKELYGQTLLQGTAIEIFYVLVVVFLSWVSYNIIEKRGRAWSKRLVENTGKIE